MTSGKRSNLRLVSHLHAMPFSCEVELQVENNILLQDDFINGGSIWCVNCESEVFSFLSKTPPRLSSHFIFDSKIYFVKKTYTGYFAKTHSGYHDYEEKYADAYACHQCQRLFAPEVGFKYAVQTGKDVLSAARHKARYSFSNCKTCGSSIKWCTIFFSEQLREAYAKGLNDKALWFFGAIWFYGGAVATPFVIFPFALGLVVSLLLGTLLGLFLLLVITSKKHRPEDMGFVAGAIPAEFQVHGLPQYWKKPSKNA